MEFFDKLTDIELLGRLIYGEARGESYEGMIAVACVAMNRAAQPTWWGTNLREVILHPWQFSCFNDAYVGSIITPQESSWIDCIKVAHGILTDQFNDVTDGATNYFADYISAPDWAREMTFTCQIGKHTFYK